MSRRRVVAGAVVDEVLAEGAALLVDHVLPAVGNRQRVLSFEGPMAQRLGYDRALLAEVAGALAR